MEQANSYNEAVKRLLAIAVEQGLGHPLFITLRSNNGIKQTYRQEKLTIPPMRLTGDDVDLKLPIDLMISDREELKAGDRMIRAQIANSDSGLSVEHETLMYDPNRKVN